MKLKYTKIKQRHILVCSDLKKEGVNRKELDVLYEPPEGLLRVLEYNDAKRIITYDVGCCIPLQSYYKQKCFTEDEVLLMVRQLLMIFINMEKSRLTMQKLVLEFKHVYYDITHAMLQVVFCPVQNNYSPLDSERIFTFLRELVTNAVIIKNNSGNAIDKIQRFLVFLNKQQQFSVRDIAVFFDEDYDETKTKIEPSIEVPRASIGSFMSSYPQADSPSIQQPIANSFEVSESNYGKPNQMINAPLPSTIKKPVPVSQTGYNTERNRNSVTSQSSTSIAEPGATVDIAEDLNGNFAEPGATMDFGETAYIRNEVTGVEYELPFGNCTIGRAWVDASGKLMKPDLAVSENMRVSRFHAQIIFDGTNYYIADLTGKNRTRVNGQLIECGIDSITRQLNGKKTLIENGTKIQLSSEEYTFIVKEL